LPQLHTYDTYFIVIIQVSLCKPASPVKNWRILLEQCFTSCIPLLTAAMYLGQGERASSLPCYLHYVHTYLQLQFIKIILLIELHFI